MKNINYYGQKITVSDEVAEFLEQDRLRESAQRRSDQRHLDFVGNEIYTMPGLFTDEPTDPTFEQAFLLLRKHKLRKIFPTLPDDDQKLLRFYYFRFYTLEQIGKEFGISKMAISKRLRKILDLLRSLMEDEAPYFSQIFLETRFTNLLCVSYKVNHKHKKALRSHSVHALHLKNLDYSVKLELLSILISEISDERIGKQEKGIGAFRANAYSQQPAVRAAARVCGFWKLTLFSRFPERFDAKFEKSRRKATCHNGLRRRFDRKSVRFIPL